MWTNFITVGSGSNSAYFCGWCGDEAALSYDDADCAYMDSSEASDEYAKLIAQSYDAEINPCWKPLFALPLYRINEGQA